MSELQDLIGWDYFIEGFIPATWIESQTQHFLSLNRLESGKRWASALIRKMWNIAWDLWEHRNSITHMTNQKIASDLLTNVVNDLFSKGSPTNQLNPLFSIEEKTKLTNASGAYT
jgi:hypothetical protein